MISHEAINALALSLMLPGRFTDLKRMYEEAGSATAIVDNVADLKAVLPDFNLQALSVNADSMRAYLDMAQQEAEYLEAHNIDLLPMNSPRYPARMREACTDAPIALYCKGRANLNAQKVISIVGTRQSTEYGHDMVKRIVDGLAHYFPDLLVVSGMAYGIDIHAHRAALDNQLPTVGVMAHGLDRIYPSVHRNVAKRIEDSGGALITDFPIGTQPERLNFLRRNRLIAAMAEGTVVIESREVGGSLNTARYVKEYNLSLMACPGRVTDHTSAGCNELIRNLSAALVTSADDIAEVLGWNIPRRSNEERLPSLFDIEELTVEEQFILDYLDTEGKQINQLVSETGLAVYTIMPVLQDLEFRGIVKQLPGSVWRKYQD